MRRIFVLALLVPLFAGCGNDPGSDDGAAEPDGADQRAASSECLPKLRYDGQTYNAIGYASDIDAKMGKATLSQCSDVGKNAQGSVFSGDARQVATYSFKNVGPSRAIAIPEGNNTYGVYMSADIPVKEAERMLLQELDGTFEP